MFHALASVYYTLKPVYTGRPLGDPTLVAKDGWHDYQGLAIHWEVVVMVVVGRGGGGATGFFIRFIGPMMEPLIRNSLGLLDLEVSLAKHTKTKVPEEIEYE